MNAAGLSQAVFHVGFGLNDGKFTVAEAVLKLRSILNEADARSSERLTPDFTAHPAFEPDWTRQGPTDELFVVIREA